MIVDKLISKAFAAYIQDIFDNLKVDTFDSGKLSKFLSAYWTLDSLKEKQPLNTLKKHKVKNLVLFLNEYLQDHDHDKKAKELLKTANHLLKNWKDLRLNT